MQRIYWNKLRKKVYLVRSYYANMYGMFEGKLQNCTPPPRISNGTTLRERGGLFRSQLASPFAGATHAHSLLRSPYKDRDIKPERHIWDNSMVFWSRDICTNIYTEHRCSRLLRNVCTHRIQDSLSLDCKMIKHTARRAQWLWPSMRFRPWKTERQKPLMASDSLVCLAAGNFNAGPSFRFTPFFTSFHRGSHHLLCSPYSPTFIGTFCVYQFVSQPAACKQAGGNTTKARI